MGINTAMIAVRLGMTGVEIANLVVRAIVYITGFSSEYRTDRFGLLRGNLLYGLGLLATDELQETETNINYWSDEEVLAWKASYIANLNAISVAVSDETPACYCV